MTRCRLCPNVNKCLPPDGPLLMGQPMFIGEAPGKDENRYERVFIGKTGREVNEHYLPLAGMRRDGCYFTNAIKCLPISTAGKLDPNRAADMALLESCALEHLYQEIDRLRPSVLVPMGTFACRAVDPEIQMDLQHGIPCETQWGIPAFPMYHPALGIHDPKKMLLIRTDWIRLKQYLKGNYYAVEDAYPNPDYAEVLDVDEIHALDPTQPMACDTESSPSEGPYFLSYSQEPGTGRLIRANRPDLLTALQHQLDRWEADILFHNWVTYDFKPVAGLGLTFPHRWMRDTMVRAYHLGNLPQGLKALSYRELGMRMQDFEDLVKPHSVPHVLDYYRRAQEMQWPKPEPHMERDPGGNWKVKKPQGMNTKLKRFFTDYSKNAEKDVFKMWTDNWEAEQPMLEAELGPFPHMDIAHVPFELSLYYACRDPDATLRLHYLEERMAANVGLKPQERWRE